MSADLDREIDRVAREMLEVDPPAGFRRRVLDRLEAPRRGFTWTWIVLPVAAAAVLLLAIVLPHSNRDVFTPRQGTDYRLSSDRAASPRTVVATRQPNRSAASSSSERTVRAASVDGPIPPPAEPMLPALAVPSPITLEVVAEGKATPLTTIDVAPMDVPALEVDALPETPRERLQD
jgi:hypothetical protein